MGILGLFVRSKEEQAVKEAERKQQQREASEEKEARRQGHLTDLRKGSGSKAASKPSRRGGLKDFLRSVKSNARGGEHIGFNPGDPFERMAGGMGGGFGGRPFVDNFRDPFERRAAPRKAVKKHSGVLIVGGKRYVRVR